MGQIVKGKKKGRPSKADLARRAASGASPAASERRRSLRRRNVRYNNFIDIDDYLDDFEEYDQPEDEEDEAEAEEEEDDDEEDDDEDEDERRKQKKLKLVSLKLNSQSQTRRRRRRHNNNGRPARGGHSRNEAGITSASEDDDEDEGSGRKQQTKKKRRRINGDGGRESEAEEVGSENDGGNDGEEEEEEEIDPEETERKSDGKGQQQDSEPGTPPDRLDSYPLPDKKVLELVLDKLQKKDTYGVYSEPVDLEGLPDYLDTIDQPMDFATVRTKLGNGSYATLEQFESDVFLICSNAMKYNSSDTIYYRQARAIQELATKKFEKIRVAIERSEKEQKSEQKTKSNTLAKKQMTKPFNRTIQDNAGSDFSSGATLANAGQVQNGSSVEILPENNLSLADNHIKKVEELSSGRGPSFKNGKKPPVSDDYRRATYSSCSQPVEGPDTIFTTFEDELRHLIAVGLHAEHFYSRSVARFAANLGPVAWKVASKRIEQALPPGCKYGRGWVAEYEPPTTPLIMFAPKYDVLFPKVKAFVDEQKEDIAEAKEHPAQKNVSEGKHSVFRPTSVLASEVHNSLLPPTGTKPILQKTMSPMNNSETRSKTSKQVELNLPPSMHLNNEAVREKQMSINSEMAASKVREVARSEGLKPREVSKQLDNNGNSPRVLQDGNTTSSFASSRPVIASCNGFNTMAQVGSNQMVRGAAYFPQVQGQVFTDPVEAMRKSAEMVRNQQKPSSQPAGENNTPRSDSSNNAAVAAARAWMSVGAGNFKPPIESSTNPKGGQIPAEYNPAWQLTPQFPRVQGQYPVQYQSEKNNFPFQAFMRPPFLGGAEAQLQGRPMVFPPQLVGASDMSRLQMISPWNGSGQSQQQQQPQFQQKQKHDTLPPDLNIGFQSPGSPAKQQSSGVMVDSQQPDLALQL